jgi:hypothetical protein
MKAIRKVFTKTLKAIRIVAIRLHAPEGHYRVGLHRAKWVVQSPFLNPW